jgi:hypothetical protein
MQRKMQKSLEKAKNNPEYFINTQRSPLKHIFAVPVAFILLQTERLYGLSALQCKFSYNC